MKLNLGCGFNKMDGYVNVDSHAQCEPDIVMDLNVLPWSFGTNEVDEIIFNHSLEKLGADTETFFGIIKEIYRVCTPNAKIEIYTTHPRHDAFLADPSNVRVISPVLFEHFSKKINQKWADMKAPNNPLAIFLDVDFEVVNLDFQLESKYQNLVHTNQITQDQLYEYMTERNNVILESRIMLRVIKE